MHLGRHDMNQTYIMKKGQELIPIEKVDAEKDLSVIIDKSQTFTEHIFQNQNSKQKSGTHISNVYIFGHGYIHEFV